MSLSDIISKLLNAEKGMNDPLNLSDNMSVSLVRYLELTNPTGGEAYEIDTDYIPVTWSKSSLMSSVDIFISINGGSSWITLGTGVTGTSRNYILDDYSGSLSPSSNCKIKVKNHSGSEESISGTFQIF